MSRFLVLLFVCVAMTMAGATSGQALFIPIGIGEAELGGFSHLSDISGNGRYVTSTGTRYSNGKVAAPGYIYDTLLDEYTVFTDKVVNFRAISNEGVAVGNLAPNIVHTWSATDGFTQLRSISSKSHIVWDIADQPGRVVGSAVSNIEVMRAAFWEPNGRLLTLGSLRVRGVVHGITPDGKTLVGVTDNPRIPGANPGPNQWTAFIWTQEDGFQGLGNIDPDDSQSSAYAISSDGSTVVGVGTSETGSREPFRWTREEGIQSLGTIDGIHQTTTYSHHGVSRDGSVIVGEDTYGAYLWTKDLGLVSIPKYLNRTLGLDLEEWRLESAVGVNDAGDLIAGNGMYGERAHPFLVKLVDEPVIDLWPPTHRYVELHLPSILEDVSRYGSIQIVSITQDEPLNARGDGNTSCDGTGVGTDTAWIRAERSSHGNGRVYIIRYRIVDEVNQGVGSVRVEVPLASSGGAIDDGVAHVSTACFESADLDASGSIDALDLSLLLAEWNRSGYDQSLNLPDGDINGDKEVDASDLGLLLGMWGTTRQSE